MALKLSLAQTTHPPLGQMRRSSIIELSSVWVYRYCDINAADTAHIGCETSLPTSIQLMDRRERKMDSSRRRAKDSGYRRCICHPTFVSSQCRPLSVLNLRSVVLLASIILTSIFQRPLCHLLEDLGSICVLDQSQSQSITDWDERKIRPSDQRSYPFQSFLTISSSLLASLPA